ncbi:MAG: HemK family protein methyltransferase [Patescibacteria group bacterium]
MKHNNTSQKQEHYWLLTEKYNGVATPEYYNDVVRLESGMPVDFLIGYREFLNCPIDLSYRPLIPRNETEFWTQDIITKYKKQKSSTSQAVRVLDICAGSGCIGIALLAHLPKIQVDFAEYNPQFIKQIHKNLELNKIDPERYHIYQSDMFTQVRGSSHPLYDLIVANPPYIARNRKDTVQQSVHHFEDHGSLYADDDGLEYIKVIISALPRYLAPGGECYIEYDSWQTHLITTYLDTYHPTLRYRILQDQNEKDRVVHIYYK